MPVILDRRNMVFWAPDNGRGGYDGRLNLRSVLLRGDFDPQKLDAKNNSHLNLVRNRSLDELLRASPGFERSEILLRYEERMAPLVREYYELILAGGVKGRTRFKDFWDGENGKVHLRILTRYLLEEEIGLVIDESTRNIDRRLFRPAQRQFLREQGVRDWAQLFARHKLGGMLERAPDVPNSIVEVFQRTYPWMFDYNTPEGQHLHIIDFNKFPVTNEEQARKIRINELKHVLERHLGLKMDEANRLIDPRLLDAKGFLKSHEVTRWVDLLEKYGARNLIYGQFQSSFYQIFRAAYPWAFDLTTDEGSHLHFWDFSYQHIWRGEEGKERAGEATRHVFQRHLGLIDEASRTIDDRLSPRNHNRIFSEQEIKGRWKELLAKEGLEGMFKTVYNHRLKELLEDAFPWIFDLRTEEGAHLHAWEFLSPNKWGGKEQKKLIEVGLRHVAERHLGLSLERDALLGGFTRTAFNQNGFTDWMRREFGYKTVSILRIAFPEIFPRTRPFQDWLDILKTGDVYWKRVPREIKRWFVDILAIELDKDVDLLVTSDFYKRLAVFGDKSLEGLLGSYRKPEMKYTEALDELKKDLGMSFQGRDFMDWLRIFRRRPLGWEKVPDYIKVQFILCLAGETERNFLYLSSSNYQKKQRIFGGKSLVTLMRCYAEKGGKDTFALVKLVRLVLNIKREELVAVRENDLLRRKLLKKGADKMFSLDKKTRIRYLEAFLDPEYFSHEEKRGIALIISLACKIGKSPMTIKKDSEFRRDIADCLVMLGLVT